MWWLSVLENIGRWVLSSYRSRSGGGRTRRDFTKKKKRNLVFNFSA